MGTEGRQSRFGLALLVGLVAIVVAFGGSASIRDRTTATIAEPAYPKALTRPAVDEPPGRPNGSRQSADAALPAALAGGSAARRNMRCAGCGVVESVRRVDRREMASGACSIAESDRFPFQGSADGGDERGGVATLADTVDGVLAGRQGTLRMKVTSSYQIVVRFRDGSRRVFNEATPRVLQSGERIQVIAGADLPTV